MQIEDFDLKSYPSKATQSPDGNQYETPEPSTHTWTVSYLDGKGLTRHEQWSAEKSSPVAEIPPQEIRAIEKRMDRPQRILAVKFGLYYFQEEPGGDWRLFEPNNKNAAPGGWYEGDYTKKYMDDWRKKAYEGHFDPFKLTRTQSREELAQQKTAEAERYNKTLQERILALEKNEAFIKQKYEQKIQDIQSRIPGQK